MPSKLTSTILISSGLECRRRTIVAALFLVAFCPAALAQDTEPSSPDGDAVKAHDDGPGERNEKHLRRPGTLPRDITQLYFPVQVSLSSGELGQPTFVSPNISHGFTKDLTVRLLHSEAWRSPSDVTGLCFTGKGRGCPHSYNNVALDVVADVVDGSTFGLTLSAGTSFVTLNPRVVGAIMGAAAEVHLSQRVSWQGEVSFVAAMINRPRAGAERVGATTRLFFESSAQTLLFALTGFFTPLDAGHQAMVPVGIGGLYALGTEVDLGVQFIFSDVSNAGFIDDRQSTFSCAYRF